MLRQHLRSPRQRHHVHVFCHSAGGVSHRRRREATGILVKRHEDTSQESASSDTEPEELAGPAGINAVGPQHSVCACFLPDCLACSSARAGQVLPGESGSQGLPKREWNNWKGRIASESTLSLVASVYDELENMLDAAPPQTRSSPVARVGLAL